MIPISPRRVLTSAALVVFGVFGATAWQRGAQAQQTLAFPPRSIRIVGIPDPHDAFVLRSEDGLFTVPEGKLFILTALGEPGATPGTVRWFQHVTVYRNGEPAIMRAGNYQETSTLQNSMSAVPPGFTAAAGETLQVVGSGGLGGNARAWGYLINE